jgi:hypothetical protein
MKSPAKGGQNISKPSGPNLHSGTNDLRAFAMKSGVCTIKRFMAVIVAVS